MSAQHNYTPDLGKLAIKTSLFSTFLLLISVSPARSRNAGNTVPSSDVVCQKGTSGVLMALALFCIAQIVY